MKELPLVQPLSKAPQLLGLDHLRAFAITIVFIYHYGGIFAHPQWVNTIGKFGWTGVDLFFVLSGYLIAAQLFATINKEEKISFKTFFIKRFFRIIPAYVFVVAIYFLIPSFREREAPAPLWKYLTFTQNLGLDISKQGTFSHAWSLCIEEQFYLFLPLILIVLDYFKAIKKGLLLLLFLFVAGFLLRLYVWHHMLVPVEEEDNYWMYWYKWIYYPTYARLDGLLMGVSIAALFQFKPLRKAKLQQYGNYFFAASLLVLTAAYFICVEEESFEASIFGFPLISVGYGLMVIGAISPTCFLYKIKWYVTTKIALLSYAIYLTHKITIHVTQQQLAKWNIAKDGTAMFFICMITSFLVAWLLHKIIERPFMFIRDKVLQRKPV